MILSRSNQSRLLFLALALLILSVDTFIARFAMPVYGDPLLVLAVMFDLMLVVPFLYWMFLLRRSKKSVSKALPLILLGVIATWFIVPASMRGLVWQAAWPVELLIALAELAVIGYELRLLVRIARRFRTARRCAGNVPDALRQSIHDTLGKGKFASLLLHDLSMVYYLLFSWKTKPIWIGAEAVSFTYHRKTSQTLFAAMLTKVIIIEGICAHVLLQMWSPWAAWIATAADLWLLMLVWADFRASSLNPITVHDGFLRLRYGLRIQADIPLDAIKRVECSTEYALDEQERRYAAMPILSVPNVKIQLKTMTSVQTLLFLPKQVQTVFLAIDEPHAFVSEVEHQQRNRS